MRKALTIIGLVLTTGAFGQVQVPALSPEAEVEQEIGLTEVEVEYSRPSVRGRKIFGELLPYDVVWRTGANKNTTISFSTSATLNGNEIEEGEYALFTKPGKNNWMIYLYSETENWGTPKEWDESKVITSFEIPVKRTKGIVETFTIQFESITTSSADLVLSWENTRIVIPVEVPTKELTKTSIEETMSGDSISERDYYGAASYYLSVEEQLEDALEFIDKAIEIRGEEAFWYLRKKALIEYKLGMKEAAIKTAKRSLSSAKKAGNNDYIKMNEDSIKKWNSEK